MLEITNWSRWSGLNRRPTVYETVALPLSYTGFGDLFQAPRKGTTTQKTPSRHPFFSSPKVLPCKPPLQDPCKESAARAKLSSRKTLTASTLPRMRGRSTRSQNPEASSFVILAARFSRDTGNGAPADASAFGHRFEAARQDTLRSSRERAGWASETPGRSHAGSDGNTAGESGSGKQESRKPGACPVPSLFSRSIGSKDRMALRCSTGPRSAGLVSCPAPTDLLAACPVRLAETAAQLREIGPPLPIAPAHRFPVAPATVRKERSGGARAVHRDRSFRP